MVFSCNPSIPSCIIEIVLRVGSSQEISTSTHCPLDCLLRGLLYTSRYVQKPVTLSRHPVRKRQGPSLKTPSLNPTDTNGCQRCIPRLSAETSAPSFPQKLLLQTLSCVLPFLGYFPANFAHHVSASYLPHLSLKCRLKSLLILNYSAWKSSLAAAEPRYNLSSNSTASCQKARSL